MLKYLNLEQIAVIILSNILDCASSIDVIFFRTKKLDMLKSNVQDLIAIKYWYSRCVSCRRLDLHFPSVFDYKLLFKSTKKQLMHFACRDWKI